MSMKTINYILGCCIAMTLLYACIDDEGNYDYSELKTVNITNVYSNWSVPLGEEYVITPTIDYGDTDPSEFVYTWVSEIQEEWSDTISRDKELRYTFKEIARYMTTFVVEHVPTGALTSKQIDLNTVSRYSTGWTILSEQNNKSVLSYIRAEQSGENSIIYNFFKDIYTTLRGDDLGTGPIRMGRHFSSSSDEILVIQESGAVEIDGQDFSKAIATHEEFVGGAYPANFVPKQAEYGARLEAILGTDGNVYTRVNPNGSFQICQYNTPQTFSLEQNFLFLTTYRLVRSINNIKLPIFKPDSNLFSITTISITFNISNLARERIKHFNLIDSVPTIENIICCKIKI